MAKVKSNNERKSIKAAAKSQVAEIFATEDVAQQKALLEEAFEEAKTQITDLESALDTASKEKETLVDEVESLKAEKEELEKTKEEADSGTEKLQKALDEANSQIEELTKKIEEMEKDAAMNLRVSELDNLGLLFTKEKLADRQKAKVRNLSEEEFAEYRDELLELREELGKETAKDDEGDKPKEKRSKNPELEEDNVDDTETDDVDETADVDDEDGEDTKTLTAAKLKELRRASAALNKASSGADVDEFGVDLKLKAKFDKIWDNDEEEK